MARQEPFECGHCKESVKPLEDGSYRNHCPKCLWSKHVDDKGPGDRASTCKSMMKPDRIDHRKKKGWMIVHLCEACGKEIPNMAACDDDLTVLKS
ncbi:MAG: RNHCP domain-containing protein [Candidatus Peribacter sp.]|nr:RNHCP domain-containing protein [Candidatus Peribacter sp.]